MNDYEFKQDVRDLMVAAERIHRGRGGTFSPLRLYEATADAVHLGTKDVITYLLMAVEVALEVSQEVRYGSS